MFQSADKAADRSAFADRPPPVRDASAPRASTLRAATTNDPLKLRGVSGCSAEARRFRDLMLAYAEPLGGRAGALSAVDVALVREAASTSLQSEAVAASLAKGESVDPEQSVRIGNALSRLLSRLERRAKAVAPRATGNPLADHFSRPPSREGRA
jgi:hypothetical protein